MTYPTLTQRAQRAADWFMQQMDEELPLDTELENRPGWRSGLSWWLREVALVVPPQPERPHNQLADARYQAHIFYENCFKQTYHSLIDMMYWEHQLSYCILRTMGYFHADKPNGPVELEHFGHYQLIEQAAHRMTWHECRIERGPTGYYPFSAVAKTHLLCSLN